MARRLKRLRRLLNRTADVQEGASCARALVRLVGENSIENWIQTVQLSQGLLTARAWEAQGNVPLPRSLSKQLDPNDASFLPPTTVMTSLFSREKTLLSDGEVGRKSTATIDPWGWFTPYNRPSLTVWCSDGDQWYCAGKLPLDLNCQKVNQRFTEDGHGIETIMQAGKLQLELLHWPSTFGRDHNGRAAWSFVFRVRALEPCTAKMALVIRPIEMDGAHPIFSMERRGDGVWLVDGDPFLMTQTPGKSALLSKYGQRDVWFQCLDNNPTDTVSKTHQISCPVGQASGAELYEENLKKGEFLSSMAVIHPPKNIQAVRRSSPETLWQSAVAERFSLRDVGARIELAHHQALFERVQQRLLCEVGQLDYEGCCAAIALARMGYVQVAGQRIGHWLETVTVEEVLESECVAILLWTAAEYVLWTRERSWLNEHLKKWTDLLDALAVHRCQTGGQALFGEDGSERWSEIWRVAALLNGVRALRDTNVSCQRWALAGAAGRDQLLRFLGPAPWSAHPDRSPDGTSAALLAVGWLNILPLDTKEMVETESFLSKYHLYDDGILSLGGAHIAKTSIWLALQKRREPTLDVVEIIAKFASPTGSLPAICHRTKGVLGDGDSLLSAAVFALMVLDDVVVHRTGLSLGGLIRQAHELPTPLGKIDILDGTVQQRGVVRN